MPKCKNDNKRYYKGNEPSPRGLGYSAQVMKEGSKKKGKDGNMWIVKKIKDGSLRWMNFENKDDYKIVDVSESNLKKYKLEADIVSSARDILLILKKKDREGVFLVKNNVIIGFYLWPVFPSETVKHSTGNCNSLFIMTSYCNPCISC